MVTIKELTASTVKCVLCSNTEAANYLLRTVAMV